MPTEAKQATVSELVEAFSKSPAAIVADYRGLKVSDLSKIRRELRDKGVQFRVAKNRLARIAADQTGRGAIDPLLSGPSAIALGAADESALARAVLDALRPYRGVVVRGGAVGRTTLDADGVTRLSQLPPRDVLLAQLGGSMASPLSTMAGLLAAPLRNLGYALKQLQEQREGEAA
jgi:large subunit ribosomal protein L10